MAALQADGQFTNVPMAAVPASIYIPYQNANPSFPPNGYAIPNSQAPWIQYMSIPPTTPVVDAEVTAPSVQNIGSQSHPFISKRHNPYASSEDSCTTSPMMPYQISGQLQPMVVADPNLNTTFDGAFSLTQQMPFRGGGGAKGHFGAQIVSAEELSSQRHTLTELARTAIGSSFIQAALREGLPDSKANVAIVTEALYPCIGDLLLDSHGCYIIKTLMERLNPSEMQAIVDKIASDESLVFSMCTHSLHTRRTVQFLMDNTDCSFLVKILAQRCEETATTQQGCIVMQRAMDVAKEPHKSALFEAIYRNLLLFAVDPFANYVIQHMLEIGDTIKNSENICPIIKRHVMELSCNKFASNVVEKCLSHLTPHVQHEILCEMYDVPEETLLAMLQDSFGNYIIQSSINLASAKDLQMVNSKLRAVLGRTPYGHKIEKRLDRRIKGRPNNNFSNNNNNNNNNNSNNNNSNNNNIIHHPQHKSYKGRPVPPTAAAEGEEPW